MSERHVHNFALVTRMQRTGWFRRARPTFVSVCVGCGVIFDDWYAETKELVDSWLERSLHFGEAIAEMHCGDPTCTEAHP